MARLSAYKRMHHNLDQRRSADDVGICGDRTPTSDRSRAKASCGPRSALTAPGHLEECPRHSGHARRETDGIVGQVSARLSFVRRVMIPPRRCPIESAIAFLSRAASGASAFR
ncbi:MAG: hypothetical protein QOF70_4170 [Acetobacteraceae bacterium]|jgi:hypothetical protein|nr:hypothetical protein [Acetobacteraceae bacterium]